MTVVDSPARPPRACFIDAVGWPLPRRSGRPLWLIGPLYLGVELVFGQREEAREVREALQIIPPNQYVPIYLGYTSQTCVKPVPILTVGAVRPGAGSS